MRNSLPARFSVLFALVVLLAAPGRAADPAPMAQAYGETAKRIIDAALASDTAYRRLAFLSDRIGHRLSGSPQLDAAIAWAAGEMKRDGLDNVRTKKVMVPHWVRGRESAELLEPTQRPLVMLGLGNSVGTPVEGITADVVVVKSFDELDKLGERVRGKVVLYNVPFTRYGATVAYRTDGPSRAARHGALAVLVRSVGPSSLRTPHTGALRYASDAPKIPGAAVTIEDAETLARMQARGEHVRLRLVMNARMLADAPSANVVAELKGRERPDEIVLVGGHLDSWDVGTGSTDDGGGCLAAWEAVRLLKQLNLRPRRTIRVVLFTNEENGLRGALGYRDAHASEIAHHVLAIESDSGVASPTGVGLPREAPPSTRRTVGEIASLLSSIRADRVDDDGGEADIGPLMERGVLGMSLNVDMSRYFDIHHTPADTFDKIDPDALKRCVAVLAVMAYVAADLPTRLEPLPTTAARR